MKFYRMCLIAGTLIVALAISLPVQANDLPSVNLGFTSFLDGGPPTGSGFYFSQYIHFWTADELKDQNGDRMLPAIADEELDTWVSLTQLIYQSNQALLLGGKWGLNVLIPYVGLDLSNNLPVPEDNGSGFGDLAIGPSLQWDPVMIAKGLTLIHRIEFSLVFPTGKYDENKELNPGSNFFSFNPYWAGTLFITSKWSATTRIHYLWNAKNKSPNRMFRAQGATDTQAGQAFHLNFASAYEVLPQKLRIGLNGYYLKQTTDTQMNGQDVPGRREQAFGIGPGAVYHYSQNLNLFLNIYFESMVENRAEGKRLNLRMIYHF